MCILLYKANATFMNSKNRKTCDQYGLSFNFADKINLKRSENILFFISKISMMNLNYFMHHIPYYILKITLNMLSKI